MKTTDQKNNVEFDQLADDYHLHLEDAIVLSGEGEDYFSEYKIADLKKFLGLQSFHPTKVLDFGSGTGNSVPFFRKYFPESQLNNTDVSLNSIELAKKRYPGSENYFVISDRIPVSDESQDLVFSACVFHHISHTKHSFWLSEIYRVLKPGGYLVIYEHNPFNPLTQWVVRNSPLDINAVLVRPSQFHKSLESLNFCKSMMGYKLFFPKFLERFRKWEQRLEWLPLGAQYRIAFKKGK